LGQQETHLLDQLAALNEARLCAPYAPIRERLDADTVSAIRKVQQIALTMRDADGVTRPHHLRPAWVAAGSVWRTADLGTKPTRRAPDRLTGDGFERLPDSLQCRPFWMRRFARGWRKAARRAR
jgi:hypothetical protein